MYDCLQQKFQQIQEEHPTMETQNIEVRKQDRQNLKTKYKNQRLEEARQIYLCECEKVYLSFPALYLHVKNKHKLKLTTKITDKICKMEEKNGKTYITYFLKNQTQQEKKKQDSPPSEQDRKYSLNAAMKTSNAEDDQKPQFSQQNLTQQRPGYFDSQGNIMVSPQIKTAINQFLQECSHKNPFSYLNIYTVVTHFANYIEMCAKSSKQFESQKAQEKNIQLALLPLYFNEFICFYVPRYAGWEMQHSIGKDNQIHIMKLFAKWLKQKQHTHYLIL